ncbi:MAG: 4-hydroxyphenylacetate 3-hydroxylase N-terminal domain-containing protein [Candidatus Eisenbacteria bacterium]
MPLKSPEEYVRSVKARKPMDVWFRGEKMKDPVTHPALKPSLETMKKMYQLAHHPKFKDMLTTTSHLTGKVCNFYTSPLMSQADAMRKTRLARAMGEVLGCCTFRCTGSEAISGLYPITYEIEKATGTKYHERLKKWLARIQEEDLTVTAALTDPKGDRKLKPHEQKDPDMYLHVVEKRKDGIVIRGAKLNQTGVVLAHEVVILPTTAVGEEGKVYAVACAVPVDSPGMKYVLGRFPIDLRFGDDETEMVDVGKKFADHQAMLIVDNVFVPWDRVFMCEEWQFTGRFLEYFTAVHRLTAGACKSGGLSLLLGATKLAADSINVGRIGHVMSKFAEMGISAETLYSMSLAAGVEGFQHESGAWIPNSLIAHSTKFQATLIPSNALRYAREIMSGIGETAPSAKDLANAEIGPMIEKYLAPAKEGMTTEDRLRVLRLIENLTRGTNWSAMAIHGGGNTEASRLMALRHMNLEKLAKIAEVACGIDKDESKAVDLVSEREGKIDYGPGAFKQ